MTDLKDKVEHALNESRILILGAQILVGLLYRSVFEPGYKELPVSSRGLILGGLGLIVIAFGLLMSPVSYHQIVEDGNDREDFYKFVLGVMELALVPFALSLGCTIYSAAEKVQGPVWGVAAGAFSAGLALLFWYHFPKLKRAEILVTAETDVGHTSVSAPPAKPSLISTPSETQEKQPMKDESRAQETASEKLKDKIKQVLTETRMVLPGAQALLGFQFVIMLMTDFDSLPESSKQIHLASLFLIALSTILLMTPAAYHRIVEGGEDSERFHRFTSRMVLAAMAPLAAGVCGDFFVVTRKVTDSWPFSVTAASILLVFFTVFGSD
ncbi:MAG: DUF6328 family protein [Terriglobia bacterium]